MNVSVVFALIAGIIIIGFAGEFFFKKTGIPIFIFLIFTGIVLGPILNFFPRESLIPELSIFAELTLFMVLFYGGLGLNFSSVVLNGGRALVQTVIYVGISIILIGLVGIFVLNWNLLSSFIFASIIGGETTAAVVVPLSKSMKLSEGTITFLTLESAVNSIFSIVLFFAFVGIYTDGKAGWLSIVGGIGLQFSIGIALGAILSLVWVFALYRFQKQRFTYVLTVGFVLTTYSLSTVLGGNGTLAVLVFGIILGNYHLLKRIFKGQTSMDPLLKQLEKFQGEISFFLESLFFVFLGLTFIINPSLIVSNLSIGILILSILLATRFTAVRVSTFKSELNKERRQIMLMCAMGLTPATLSVLAVSLQLPLSDTFLNIVTYVIILTNVVTTVGSILNKRKQTQEYKGIKQTENWIAPENHS
ncbi:MAG TPA: cation:proton antiporter [Candidatus Nanoarchaeia archaeon]|nr:cation:proton antiporter [Candidatus Nanoarchaeia archaeon]